MKIVKKVSTVLLALMVLNFVCFDAAYAASSGSKEKITKTAPSGISSPEVTIPRDKKKEQQSWLSKHKWWIIAGLALVAGGAAAAGGGGGGGDDSGGVTPAGEDTGNVTVSWAD